MAGESPDKSEQRKSSGETAPGERDPRLAVFRESAGTAEPESSDRVDQPTAVFKLPLEEPPTAATAATEATEAEKAAPEPPEGDARLRAAVAAWVATADTPEGAGEDATPEAEAAGTGRPGARAAAAAEARTHAPTAEPDREGGRTAASAQEAEGAPATGESAEGPSATAPGAEAKTDAPRVTRTAAAAAAPERAEQSVAASGTEGDGDEPSSSDSAAAAPRASADASGAGRADARASAGEPSADGTGAEQKAGAGDSCRPAAAAEARGDASTPGTAEASASDEADANANTSSTSSRAAAEPLSGAAPESGQGDTTPGPAAGPPDGSRASGVDRESGRATAGADGRPEADGGPRGGSGGSGVGRESGRVAAGDGAGGRPVADAGSQGGSGVSREGGRTVDGVDGRPEVDAGPRSGSEGAGVGREGGRVAGGVDSSGGRPVAGAGMQGGAGAGRVAERGDGPAVSRGDESSGRADEGATGSSDAAGRGAEQAGGAVDQATAVFKAVRPRQAVDQPTTALKAVGGPQSAEPAESAAERTSQFVPLKRDDVRPSPARPRSTPAASPVAPPAPAAAPASAPLPEAERTRQQPLPPRPPLDLLAELTNTPPPPETPVRTAVRRVKIWAPLVLLLVIVIGIAQAVRPLPDPQLTMTAEQEFTFDGEKPSLPWPGRGQAFMAASGVGTLGSSGEQTPVPIASVTKAMTAYVILKEHPLKRGEDGPLIEIDAKGASDGQLDKTDNESTLNTVKEGDKLSLRDAIAAIMIPSANNIARQLARWDAGSEEAFVKKMNDAAKDLGMKNTTYTDPSGLDATTVSTAEDQVKLGLELVEMPALTDVTKLPTWTDPSGKSWRNWNDLVPYDGALGIKTGSTTKAGGNLLFAAHKQVGDTDQLIVGAVLAQHATPILGTAIAASKELMLATQDTLTSRTVVKKGDVVGMVDDGLGGTTPVVATKDVKAVGWGGLTVKLVLSDGGSTVPHSAKAGTKVGMLTVGEGASQVKVPVALQKDLAEPGFGDKLTRIG